MKTTRNELIDLFTKYKVRSNYKPMYEIADMIIDRFKSINSASNESLSVTENEAQEKPCMNTDCRHHNGIFNRCKWLCNKDRWCMQGG